MAQNVLKGAIQTNDSRLLMPDGHGRDKVKSKYMGIFSISHPLKCAHCCWEFNVHLCTNIAMPQFLSHCGSFSTN